MISGLIKSKNETIRKSIEQTFKVLCHHIEDKQGKEEAATKQATHEEPVGSGSSLVANDQMKQLAKNESDLNPKLFILKILIKNLPQSVVKGRLRNMENEFFDEYFGLLSSLIKICQHDFSTEKILDEDDASNKDGFFNEKHGKFDSERILAFSVEIIKLNHYVLSGLIM